MMKKKGELVIRNEPKSLGERFEDDFDAIYRHYMNPKAELSEKQKVQLSRWTWCREWFLEFEPNTKQEIVIALRRQFEISEKQAYTDVQNSMRFFASMEQVNKEMEKVMMVSRIKKRRKALDENGLLDPKAAGEATKADKLLAEILGFMEPDRAIPTPVVIEINPVFDPAILGFLPIENLELKLRKYKERKKKEYSGGLELTEILERPYATEPKSE